MIRKSTQTLEINGALLLATFAAGAIVVVGGYFWHRHQLRRIADSLLQRAEVLEAEGRFADAAGYLHRYLRIHGEHAEAHVKLAQTYDKTAQDAHSKARAVELYYIAIGAAPDREQLRERLAVLLLELRRFGAAESEAEQLLAGRADHPIGLKVKALSKFGHYQQNGDITLETALAEVESALERLPDDFALVGAYSVLVLKQRSHANADELVRKLTVVLDRLVASSTTPARAHLARFHLRRVLKHPQANEDLARARKLAPDDPVVLMAAAEEAVRQGDLSRAQSLFSRVIEVAPMNPAAYVRLCDVLMAEGDHQQALRVLEQGQARLGASHIALNTRLIDLLITAQALDDADDPLKRLETAVRTLPPTSPAAQTAAVLRGWWWLEQGNPSKSISVLKRLATQAERTEEVTLRALKLLGDAYSRAGQWDLAAATFERLLNLQPESGDAIIAAAEAWSSAGRSNEALRLCERALEATPPPSNVLLLHARLLLQQQATLAPALRNWKQVDQALAAAEDAHADAWQLPILTAQRQIEEASSQGVDRAVVILQQAEARFHQDPSFQSAVAGLYQRLKRYGELERFLSQTNASNTQRLIARASRLLADGDMDEARQSLRAAYEGSRGHDRQALAAALAGLERRAGRLGHEEPYLADLAAMKVDPVEPLCSLCENALQRNRSDLLEKWEFQLRAVEGQGGTHWRYYRARRLLSQARDSNDIPFRQVIDLHGEIESARPQWSAGHVLGGLMAEFRGNRPSAIDRYKKAVELGEDRLAVFEQLVTLLYEENRYSEAEEYLGKLRGLAYPRPELSALVVRLATEGQQIERAVELARQAVAEQPADVMARVWLLQTLLLAGDSQAAEEELRQVLDLAPDDIRIWSVAFSHYLRRGDRMKALETLSQLSQSERVSPRSRDAAVAEGYRALGDDQRAEEYYRKAELATTDESDQGDMRLQATLVMRRGGPESLKKAQRIMEQVVADPSATPRDRLLLAQLHESRNQPQAARERYLALLQRDQSNEVLSAYIEFLLRQNELDEVSEWLAKLEQQSRHEFATLSLKAKYLTASGRASEIAPLVNPIAETALKTPMDDNARAVLMQQIAKLYADAGQRDEVERWLRRLATDIPGNYSPLASWLAQQGRMDDAVWLCTESLRREGSSRPAEVLARLLVSHESEAGARQRADALLEQALIDFPKDFALLHATADLRLKQRRLDEALRLYERALELEPHQHLVLNNMASILLELGELAPALSCIDRAIASAGSELPPLMDTKATILLYQGKASEALELLERVTAGAGGEDPRLFLRLALAYVQTGLAEKAREALDDAYSLDIETAYLSKRERTDLETLKQELSSLP